MPITSLQKDILKLLAKNKNLDAYLAGGSALHLLPNTKRYSNDLDFFHDSENRVQETFKKDLQALEAASYKVEVTRMLPGLIKASVGKNNENTKIEWVHDTAWRFMPVVKHEELGFVLHPIDNAINKILALVGRNEPRDFIDAIDSHANILPLGAIIWAACGKDPGYTPHSLLELLKRKGSYRIEDFEVLHLATPVDLQSLKVIWQEAISQAEDFIESRLMDEIGCLYYDSSENCFTMPKKDSKDIFPHYGRPGGLLPQVS